MADIVGAHLYQMTQFRSPLLVVLCAVVVLVTIVAWGQVTTRLAAVLLIGLTLVLLGTPSWFGHYAALTAPPLAVVFGSGTQRMVDWFGLRHRSLRMLAMVGFAVVLAVYAFPLTGATSAGPFPGQSCPKRFVEGRAVWSATTKRH